MQNVLSTPVPSVLAWNSRAEDDPVGAEYIIMQKAPGTPLSIVWDSLELNERLKVAMKLFRYMKKWSSVSFLQQGSLYFASDEHQTTASDTPLYTRSDGSTEKDSRYRVGPSTGREWVDAGRQAIQCSRGPCKYFLRFQTLHLTPQSSSRCYCYYFCLRF